MRRETEGPGGSRERMVNLLSHGRERGGRGEPLTLAELDLLGERLCDARAWALTCSASLPVASRLRSTLLAPDLEEAITPASLEATLHEIAARRATELAVREQIVAPLERGRLLVCEIDMSIADGRSEAASKGFFDVDDRPPWDLWLICHSRSRTRQPDEPLTRLIAWVPDALVELADAGIESNRCRCVYWPADGAPELAAQLDELCASDAATR